MGLLRLALSRDILELWHELGGGNSISDSETKLGTQHEEIQTPRIEESMNDNWVLGACSFPEVLTEVTKAYIKSLGGHKAQRCLNPERAFPHHSLCFVLNPQNLTSLLFFFFLLLLRLLGVACLIYSEYLTNTMFEPKYK